MLTLAHASRGTTPQHAYVMRFPVDISSIIIKVWKKMLRFDNTVTLLLMLALLLRILGEITIRQYSFAIGNTLVMVDPTATLRSML